MSGLTVALAQVTGSFEPQKNLDTAGVLVAEAAQAGADLVVFPEMFMALPKKEASLADLAENLDGSFTSGLAALAEENHIAVCAGIWEQVEQKGEERVYNTAILISNKGQRLTAYRKLHLFDAMAVKESEKMIAGNALPPVVEIDGIKVGLAICYDIRFPELFRSLSRGGVDLFVIPAAWYAGPMKEEMWLTFLRARAMENVCYTAGAVLTGPPFSGRSSAFDPFGTPLADAGESEGLIFFTVSRERIDTVRGRLPSLAHCRFDLFSV